MTQITSSSSQVEKCKPPLSLRLGLCLGVAMVAIGLVLLAAHAQAWLIDELPEKADSVEKTYFGMTFMFFGGFAVFAFLLRLRVHRSLNEAMGLNPEMPWRWRDDWTSGLIEPNDSRPERMVQLGGGLLFLWMGGLVGCLSLKQQDLLGVCFGAVFISIGVWTSWAEARNTLARWLYGPSRFRLVDIPGKIGGQLAGTLIGPKTITRADHLEFRLMCTQEYEGDGDSTGGITTVWSQTQRVLIDPRVTCEEGVAVPVVFDLPSAALATDLTERIEWKLRVKAVLLGLNYHCEFAVPVYQTADKRRRLKAQTARLENEEIEPLDERLAKQGLVVERTDRCVRYHSPPGRHGWHALLCTILPFSLVPIWMAVCFNWNGWAPRFEWELFSVGTSVIFGLGLLFALPIPLLAWLGCSDLTISDDRWTCQAGWHGFLGEPYAFNRNEIAEMKLQYNKRSRFTGGLPGADVILRLRNGVRIHVVRAVTGSKNQMDLLGELQRRVSDS